MQKIYIKVASNEMLKKEKKKVLRKNVYKGKILGWIKDFEWAWLKYWNSNPKNKWT